MASEILLSAIKRNAPLKGGALIDMILKPDDITKYSDVLFTLSGERIGILGELAAPGWIGRAVSDYKGKNCKGLEIGYINREVYDFDAIIARLEEIRVSIWAED